MEQFVYTGGQAPLFRRTCKQCDLGDGKQHFENGQVLPSSGSAACPLLHPLSAPLLFRRHVRHHRRTRRQPALGIRRSPTKGQSFLVVLQEPAAGVDAVQPMANRPLAAGRPGSVGRRDRQLPGDGTAGREPEPAGLDVAAEGGPHLRGQPRGRRLQLRGGPGLAGEDGLGSGGGRHGAPGGARQGGPRPAAGGPALPRRRVLRRQVRRHARGLRRQGRPRRPAQPHPRRRRSRR